MAVLLNHYVTNSLKGDVDHRKEHGKDNEQVKHYEGNEEEGAEVAPGRVHLLNFLGGERVGGVQMREWCQRLLVCTTRKRRGICDGNLP